MSPSVSSSVPRTVSVTPMCLDAGSPPRRNGGVIALGKCGAGDSNQAWVINGSQIEVKDTIAAVTPMCLDMGNPPRRNGGVITLWKCEAGNHNQAWVINGSQIKVRYTPS